MLIMQILILSKVNMDGTLHIITLTMSFINITTPTRTISRLEATIPQ